MSRRGQLQPHPDVPSFGVYAVAFSFAGKQADLVREIALAVETELLPGEVFFDESFANIVQDTNTASFLPDVYGNRCVLAVRCLSDEYHQNLWPTLECGAIEARRQKPTNSALDPVLHPVLDILVTAKTPVHQIAGCNINAATDKLAAINAILARLKAREQSTTSLDVNYRRITCDQAKALAIRLEPLIKSGLLWQARKQRSVDRRLHSSRVEP